MSGFPRLEADGGRIVRNPDVPLGELKLALFRTPGSAERPQVLLLAASSSMPGWRREYVEISHAGCSQLVQTAVRKSTLGYVESAAGPTDQFEVSLHDSDQWLVSCRDEDLALGANLAMLGNELIQFGEATSLGGGRFLLGRLLRNRAESMNTGAPVGPSTPFVLIERASLQPITMPFRAPGFPVIAKARNAEAQCSLEL